MGAKHPGFAGPPIQETQMTEPTKGELRSPDEMTAALAQFGISGQDIEAAISESKRGPGRPPLDPAEREKRLEQEREHKIQTTAILAEARKEVLREKARIAAEERAQRNAMKIELARVRAEEKETARLRRAEDMRIAREAREAAAAAIREEKRAKRERAREAKERELDARRAQRAKEYTKRIAEKAEAKARERAASLAALEERIKGWEVAREKKTAEKRAEREAREARKTSRYDKRSRAQEAKFRGEQHDRTIEKHVLEAAEGKAPRPVFPPTMRPLRIYDDARWEQHDGTETSPRMDAEDLTDGYRDQCDDCPGNSIVFSVRDYVPNAPWPVPVGGAFPARAEHCELPSGKSAYPLGKGTRYRLGFLYLFEWLAEHPDGCVDDELVTWQEWFAASYRLAPEDPVAMYDGLTEDVLRGLLGAKQSVLRTDAGEANPYALPADAGGATHRALPEGSSNFEPGR